jgi:hypothetical protein
MVPIISLLFVMGSSLIVMRVAGERGNLAHVDAIAEHPERTNQEREQAGC